MIRRLLIITIAMAGMASAAAFNYLFILKSAPFDAAAAIAANAEAVLLNAYRGVNVKRENGLDWARAALNAKLFSGDSIRTAPGSRATIAIGKSGSMEIGEDSLVQLTGRVVLKQGEFTLDVGAGAEKGMSISTPDGDFIIAPRREVNLWIAGRGLQPGGAGSPGGAVSVQVSVSRGRPTRMQVLEGTAEIRRGSAPEIELATGAKLEVAPTELKIEPPPQAAQPALAEKPVDADKANQQAGILRKPASAKRRAAPKPQKKNEQPPPKLQVDGIIWE